MSHLIGRDKRDKARELRAQKRRALLEGEFQSWVSYDFRERMNTGQLTPQLYSAEMVRLKSNIIGGQYSTQDIFWLLTALASYSGTIINTQNLKNITPEAFPNYYSVPASMRDKRGLLNARSLYEWDDRANHIISQNLSLCRTANDVLGIVLWSSISRSFLLDLALLQSLARSLLTCHQPIRLSAQNKPCIKLEIRREHKTKHSRTGLSEHIGNSYIEGELIREHFFEPDPITLGLIARFLRMRMGPLQAPNTKIHETTLFKLIKTGLWQNQQEAAIPGQYKTLNSLLRYGYWLNNLPKRAPVSESLLSIRRGKLPSISLDETAFALAAKQFKEPPETLPKITSKIVTGLHQNRKSIDVDWGPFKALQSLFKETRINPKMRRPDFQARLTQIRNTAKAGTVQHFLIAWYLSIFEKNRRLKHGEKRFITISTLSTYHSTLAVHVIDALGDRPLCEFSAEEIEVLYMDIFNGLGNLRQRLRIGECIKRFHNFMICETDYQLGHLQLDLPFMRAQKRVRARTLPFKAYTALLTSLRKSFGHDRILVRVMLSAVILSYRAGLRLGEVMKLRLCDIEPSDDLVLRITTNKYGNNKTHHARRQITLAPLLTSNERQVVEHFINFRRQHHPDGLLLADHNNEVVINGPSLSKIIGDLLNRVTGQKGWVFHHLRHSAANNVFLALEEAKGSCEHFSGWNKAQQRQVISSVMGSQNLNQIKYTALASFIGHATSHQTFVSYIHTVDRVISEKSWRKQNVDFDLLKAIIPFKSRDNNLMGAKQVVNSMLENCTEQTKTRKLKKLLLPQKPLPSVDSIENFDLCLSVLKMLEKGQSPDEVGRLSPAPASYCKAWHDSARYLASLKTKRGSIKLFSIKRLSALKDNPHMTELLLPKTIGPEELEDASQLTQHLSKLEKSSKADFIWLVSYFIYNTNSNQQGLLFKDTSNFTTFVSLMTYNHVPGSRWRMELIDMPPREINKWRIVGERKGIYDFKIKRPRNHSLAEMPGPAATGRARLHLTHYKHFDPKNSNTKTIEKRRGAQTMRYVFHIVAILMKSKGYLAATQ